MTTNAVRLRDAALAEFGEELFALGFLGIDDLTQPNRLRVDSYQREVLTASTSLDKAVVEGKTFPAIVLGVRSLNYHNDGPDMLLKDMVFIIDGLQRVSAIRKYAEAEPEKAQKILLGAELRFGTTFEKEKHLFHVLNAHRTAVSPNVLLRNLRDKYKVLATLYGLSTNDAQSPLFSKVQWGQRAATNEIISANIIVRSLLGLYQHVSTAAYSNPRMRTGAAKRGVENHAHALENKSKVIGLESFRRNLVVMFELIDEIWGFRHIEQNHPRPYLKYSFLLGLCMLLSEHVEFWKGHKLVVPAHIRKRLAAFPFTREDIAMLLRGTAGSGSGTAVADILIRHVNRGKSSRKLQQRAVLVQD
jgi:hypothetical protein